MTYNKHGDCIRFAKICNNSGDPSDSRNDSTMKKHREYNTRFTLEKVRSILLTNTIGMIHDVISNELTSNFTSNLPNF